VRRYRRFEVSEIGICTIWMCAFFFKAWIRNTIFVVTVKNPSETGCKAVGLERISSTVYICISVLSLSRFRHYSSGVLVHGLGDAISPQKPRKVSPPNMKLHLPGGSAAHTEIAFEAVLIGAGLEMRRL
jgi:hypothetical protein